VRLSSSPSETPPPVCPDLGGHRSSRRLDGLEPQKGTSKTKPSRDTYTGSIKRRVLEIEKESCRTCEEILLGSLHLLVKQLCNLCAVQALALARAGEIWNWRAELTELLEQDLTISGPERLLTAGMVQNWEDDLASRVNRSNKRRGEDYRKAQAKKRRIKQRHVEATRATKGRADSYNFDHDPNMWELWTAEKREEKKVSRPQSSFQLLRMQSMPPHGVFTGL
jgi:hypothetical protein